ncbi:MAG: cysteine hydrolase [Euryarchaeota archaeon]|nr:cysteine hydrolase [Euryarchaeota archaeon]
MRARGFQRPGLPEVSAGSRGGASVIGSKRSTALLVMDVQVGIVDRFGEEGRLTPLARALEAARGAGILVVFVRVAFRPGHPEVSSSNRAFSALRASQGFEETDPRTQVHPSVAPHPGESIVTKRRVSAFSGSDLEVLLRSAGIETLVLTGIATSGVVLSTLREAADKDYHLVVLSDACLDQDAEVHRVLVEKVFPRQAEVLRVDDWVGRLTPQRS